jgi:drug/metabolite transporter (DMT)-like permease
MVNWLLLTFLAVIFRSIQSLGTKLLSGIEVSAATQSLLFSFISLVFAIPMIPFIGGLSFHGASDVWFTIIAMALALGLGNTIFFMGQNKLDAGYTQIAFSSILIWGTIFSIIFLGSHFDKKQLFGILLLLISILAIQYNGKTKTKLNAGVVYILISAFFVSIFQVTSAKLAPHIGTGAYLFFAYLGSSLVVGITNINKIHNDLKILRNNALSTFKFASVASLASLLYFIFSFYAYKHAPNRGVVVVLLTVQVVLSVLLAALFLNERSNLGKKTIGSILAIVAANFIR